MNLHFYNQIALCETRQLWSHKQGNTCTQDLIGEIHLKLQSMKHIVSVLSI